jgi:ubiquinone/menaquinone biosynthesis C-methylase UbiE
MLQKWVSFNTVGDKVIRKPIEIRGGLIMESPNSKKVESLYRKRAKHYNFTANLYYLAGFREWTYRKEAVNRLELSPGNTVVEIGCGTGLNFSLFEEKVGITGKIIGLDLTDAMLEKAAERVRENKWQNVELVHGSAESFKFPDKIDGIISTFALSLMPDISTIIQNGAKSLSAGKRWVVLDLKLPSSRLASLWPVILPFVKPFGVTRAHINQRPWEIIYRAFSENLQNVGIKELYAGFSFIIGGKA